MDNFRLQVFRSVATHLSFTKAANELFITQPAVTKNIKALESEYGLRFFSRKGNRIYLTPEGSMLLRYVDEFFALERKLDDDLNYFREHPSGLLRLGASTTIAQYVIPPVLSEFSSRFPNIKISLNTANTEQIAYMLLHGEIDLGLVEGKIRNKDIHYIRFIPDELAAVTRTKNNLITGNTISLKEMISLPLVLRERGSGTLDVIEHALKQRKVNLNALNILMYLGSTEAIKLYMESADCVSFISTKALEKELKLGTLRIIKIRNFRIGRIFDFITPHGLQPSKIALSFIKTARDIYNQK
jgi:DNA-binding transcriptional LysR family regulator